jgi:hypothetical protein
MMAQFKAYAPKIIQYQAGEALTAGDCVSISGFTTVENPVPNLSLTVPCPQVSKCPANAHTDFLGVVLNDAANGEWVDVDVEVQVDAKFVANDTLAAGDPLMMSGTPGQLTDVASSALLADPNNVVAYASEADDTTTAGELSGIYIPPRRVTCASSLI